MQLPLKRTRVKTEQEDNGAAAQPVAPGLVKGTDGRRLMSDKAQKSLQELAFLSNCTVMSADGVTFSDLHCSKLAEQSGVLRNLIAQQATLPACIILPDTGVKLVLPLDYIHNRDFEVTEGNVVLALEMSQRYDMPDLRADCGQALCRFDLTVGNVRPWLLTAEKYGCSAAVDRCVAFTDDNISQILESLNATIGEALRISSPALAPLYPVGAPLVSDYPASPHMGCLDTGTLRRMLHLVAMNVHKSMGCGTAPEDDDDESASLRRCGCRRMRQLLPKACPYKCPMHDG